MEHKTFAATPRRTKAFHTLLSALQEMPGYRKPQLIAYLCDEKEAVVYDVLIAEGNFAADWRRTSRPSGAEIGSLENGLELLLTCAKRLYVDGEVVVQADDGMYNAVQVRDVMLYFYRGIGSVFGETTGAPSRHEP